MCPQTEATGSGHPRKIPVPWAPQSPMAPILHSMVHMAMVGAQRGAYQTPFSRADNTLSRTTWSAVDELHTPGQSLATV